MPSELITVPVTLGLLLLLLSLLPIFQILTLIRTGAIRSGWLTLAALVFLFIPGYVVFAWLHARSEIRTVDVVVGWLLFFGACFVLGVSSLSRQTATDILRIATLERNVFTDELTGLFNRRYLSTRLEQEIAKARRFGIELSIIMLDIDHFKSVNDTYGHQIGDEVLRSVCVLVSQVVRASDIAVRYGGEEVLIVLTSTNTEGALNLAERLRSNIDALRIHIGSMETIRVSASIGVASLTNGDDADSVVKRADEALYSAKRQGRNRVCEKVAA